MNKRDFGMWVESLGFVPEVRFRGDTGKRQFRWDWAREDIRVAVEYAGIMYSNASHMSVAGVLRDDEKTTLGQLAGWIVVRVNAKTVGDGRAQDWVEKAIALRSSGIINGA